MDASEIDLNEWWAVCTNGEWFCGKHPVLDSRVLESLQKISMPFSVQPTKSGGVAPRTDVLVYPWFTDRLAVPEGALWISLQALKHAAPWEKLIAASEHLKMQQRAQRSGLHLA
jgi:hypothetical protein